MFRKYSAGQFVPAGIYFNRKTWELAQISGAGDYLQGGEGAAYHRVPLPLVMVLGPLVGLAFILFLPFAVPLVVIHTAVKVISREISWGRRKEAKDELPVAR